MDYLAETMANETKSPQKLAEDLAQRYKQKFNNDWTVVTFADDWTALANATALSMEIGEKDVIAGVQHRLERPAEFLANQSYLDSFLEETLRQAAQKIGPDEIVPLLVNRFFRFQKVSSSFWLILLSSIPIHSIFWAF